ncbi:hypothetical protein GCM10010156_61370 [Planobispora rosea]|uniref:MEDS domain-containing protein n=1 Tax=Planobispora rosea TaxID=35762 RepID=A0A8J3WFL1_PLARO|nr:MEDS domain-containing protein [Planobispora rosea]GGS94829.1 hypothetical protein GCM10010156_61370 [Planobispora rosea]GIH87438.1 hypothetical protein Pro02_58460 [Planobispora rosea]
MSALTDDLAISGGHLGAFEHVGLLYDGVEDYLAGVLPFVHDALAAGQPVLVAVPHPSLGPIRTALAAALNTPPASCTKPWSTWPSPEGTRSSSARMTPVSMPAY